MANQPLDLLLDVKHRRKAEVPLGDIFTSCQGWRIFLLKEQNSLLTQLRPLGIVKVDILKNCMASDRKTRSFLWEQGSQKVYSALTLGTALRTGQG